MKKVKCWKCEGTGKVRLELPRICIGSLAAPRTRSATSVKARAGIGSRLAEERVSALRIQQQL
jgi:hypothetical protein